MEPKICHSNLTGRWYVVTFWNKDGSARYKLDITDEMNRVLRENATMAAPEPEREAAKT